MFLFLVAKALIVITAFAFASADDYSIKNIKINPIHDISRSALLDLIDKKLTSNGYVYLIGFGGMGKSRLAKHFCERNKNIGGSSYKIIWWIDGKKDLFDQLKALVREIKKHNTRSNISDSAARKEILMDRIESFAKENNQKILIVFDSLEDPKSIKYFLENNRQDYVNILITSRKDHDYSSNIKVTPFTRKQSLEYLKKTLPTIEMPDLEKLANTLHDYPLALSQSAHFIQRHKAISIDEYTALYKNTLKKLWDREEKYISQDEENANSVQTTVKLSLQEIQKNNLLPKQILIICSLLNNQFIPEDLIYDVCISLGWSKEDIQDSLSLLINYDFINTERTNSNKTFYNIHEIIQCSVISESDDPSIRDVSKKLSKKVLELMMNNKNRMISFCKENHFLIGHISKLLENLRSKNLLKKTYFMISTFFLDYLLYVKRDHQEALKIVEDILNNLDYVEDPIINARFLSSAGDVVALHKLGEKIETDIVLEMKKLLSSAKIKDNYEIVRLQNSIAQNLLLKNSPSEAKKYIDSSLKLVGPFPEAEAKIPTLYFASWSCHELEHYEEALVHVNKAILLFDYAPDTAIKFYIYNNKSLALLELKKYQEALDFSDISVCKCKNYFGSQSADTLAEALAYKAKAYLHIKGHDLAYPMAKQAMDIYKAFYKGPDKVLDQATVYMICGDCFLLKGDISKASSSYVLALKVLEKLSESKSSKFYHRLIVRLIFATNKLHKKNINERYINLYKENFTKKNVNPRLLYKYSPLEIISNF